MAQKTVGFHNAWTAGEIGPRAQERSDLQQHAKGCAEATNLLVTIEGPLESRGGFWDVGGQIDAATGSRIVPFVRSSDDALLLEFGDETMRVRLPNGDPVMAGPSPYELATPWTAAVLGDLAFLQVGDVLYATDRAGRRTKVLIRSADDAWAVQDFQFRDGPWLGEQLTTLITLTPSAVTGSGVTLTASGAIFQPGHVGARVRVRQGDGGSGFGTWTTDTDYAGGDKVQFDGRVYVRAGSGGATKSGTTPPLHSEGTVSDGKIDWTFLHDGAGVAIITGYTSATVVTATIERQLPSTSPTKYWALHAYSDVEGWPRALSEEREERLVLGGSVKQPGRVDATRSFGFGPNYGDFKPGLGSGRVVDDDAVSLNVGGASRLVWLASATMLLAGCTDGIHVVSGQTFDDPMTPAGRRARRILKQGAADVLPLLIGGPPPIVLFVTRTRKTLRELRAAADLTVDSRNLTLLAPHVAGRGIAELAWQDEPDSRVWMRLDDGGLAVMTYDLENQVWGITRQALPEGWTCDGIASVPTPDGGDVLFAAVSRPIEGGRQRRIWRLAPRSELMFLDGARRYDGEPEIAIGGLEHLEGDVVAIVADGARVPDQTVTAGAITLPDAASVVDVGLKMRRRFKSLPLDVEGPGSTNARQLQATHATAIVTGVEFLIGDGGEQGMFRLLDRRPAEPGAPIARRQRHRAGVGSGVDRDKRLIVESDAPFDLILHALRLEAEVTP